MPPAYFAQSVNVYRRASTGRDSLNNPTYGTPVTGAGWTQVYAAMPCKLAFSAAKIQFAMTGERPEPTGVMYFGKGFSLQAEDRVVTVNNLPTGSASTQYVVVSIVTAYSSPTSVDHYEAILSLTT